MNLRKKERNIPIMYAICFFQGIVLYASISTLYRQARGLSLAEYAIIDGFSYLFQLAFEIPFGMLADRMGYKKTLVLSNGIYLLSKIVFWQAFSFGSFLLERLFFAMALAGLSGLDTSILYLSCGKQDSQNIFSWYGAFGTAGMLTGCLIFTLFLSTNYDATAFGTVLAYGVAFVLSFFVTDVRDEEPRDPRPSFRRLTEILKLTLKDRKFLLFLLGDALICYGAWASRVFLSQQKMLSVGLTEQHIGWLEIVISCLALSAVASAFLTKKLGFKGFFVSCVLTISAGALILGITGNPALAILCSILIDLACCWMNPLTSQLYNRRVTVSDRATQLSVYAMLTELLSFGISFLMAAVSARSALGAFVLCSAMALVGVFLFLYCYKGVPTLEE